MPLVQAASKSPPTDAVLIVRGPSQVGPRSEYPLLHNKYKTEGLLRDHRVSTISTTEEANGKRA